MRPQPARAASRGLFARLSAASQWGEGVRQEKAQGGGGGGQELRRGAGPGTPLPRGCATREALRSFQDAGCWQALLTSTLVASFAKCTARRLVHHHHASIRARFQKLLPPGLPAVSIAPRHSSDSTVSVNGDLFFHFGIESILGARADDLGQVRLRNRDLPLCQASIERRMCPN